MVHGCTLYAERSEMAVVSRGTSHVTSKQRCKYITSVDIQNVLKHKKQRTDDSHSLKITCDKSIVSLLESGEQRYIKAINNNSLVFVVVIVVVAWLSSKSSVRVGSFTDTARDPTPTPTHNVHSRVYPSQPPLHPPPPPPDPHPTNPHPSSECWGGGEGGEKKSHKGGLVCSKLFLQCYFCQFPFNFSHGPVYIERFSEAGLHE